MPVPAAANKSKPAGCYRVYAYPPKDEHARDIMFELADAVTSAPVPKEQGVLKSESERTLHVLRSLFPAHEDARFRPYFGELLGLCQYGLVGVTAQPVQAMETLRNLQNQIFDSEKGRCISQYMRNMIKLQAVLFSLLAIVVCGTGAVLNYLFGASIVEHYALIFVLPGLFVGLILSCFVRCRTVTFFDLHAIEADRFTPGLKFAFVLCTAVLAAAFLKAELIEIKIGKAQLSHFHTDWLSAFTFGAIVGMAQEAIIAHIETMSQKLGRAISNSKKAGGT
jgi:hypothetical protein